MAGTAESRAYDAGLIDPGIRPVSVEAKPQRNSGLDFTKGTLVLFMVLYHWINYFIGSDWPSYRYLRFLTPSFIFITGFMISNVYLSKYSVTDFKLISRLFTRGVKLLVIFVLLNVTQLSLRPMLPSGAAHFNPLDSGFLVSTFVTGEFNGKGVSFYILVPIAYLLIFSAILMIPLRFYRHTFHLACTLLLATIGMLDVIDRKDQTLEIIAIGMLGVLIGFIPIAQVNRIVWHPYLLGVGYCLYLIAISIWNVPYPLEIAGTLLSVAAIYLIGSIDRKRQRIRSEVILLGKYSLFGYIAQIAILQMLHACLQPTHRTGVLLLISLPAAFVLTVISVEAVERARMRSGTADKLYKAVFN